VSRCFRKDRIKAELDEKIHFHTLKHGFVKLMDEEGVQANVTGKILRQKNARSIQSYRHVNDRDMRKAIKKIQRKQS